MTSLSVKPWRTISTALGTILGVAALVGIFGLATTARQQVTDRFDLLEATEVLGTMTGEIEPMVLQDRLQQQPLSQSAGVFRTGRVATMSTLGPLASATIDDVSVVEASPGFFDAREVTFRWGRGFDRGHVERSDRVVVLGSAVADALGVVGVQRVDTRVWIDDVAYGVLGVIDSSPRMSTVDNSLVIPLVNGIREVEGLTQFSVLTRLGDATRLAPVLAEAASPGDPGAVTVVRPPEPGNYRADISEDIRQLVGIASGLALLIGVLGIANVTSVSVVERTSELGLRMALGAKTHHLVGQVVLEAALVGAWGGLFGTAAGVAAVVVGSAVNSWRPAVPTLVLAVGPLVGLAIGTLAGLVPAFRISQIQPDQALRTE